MHANVHIYIYFGIGVGASSVPYLSVAGDASPEDIREGDPRDGPEQGEGGRAKLPLKHDARISSQTASFLQRGNELDCLIESILARPRCPHSSNSFDNIGYGNPALGRPHNRTEPLSLSLSESTNMR